MIIIALLLLEPIYYSFTKQNISYSIFYVITMVRYSFMTKLGCFYNTFYYVVLTSEIEKILAYFLAWLGTYITTESTSLELPSYLLSTVQKMVIVK